MSNKPDDMKTVTESIFSGKSAIIPLADVQHIERLVTTNYTNGKPDGTKPNGIHVITSKTRWDMAADTWANSIYLTGEEEVEFLAAWCRYRSELESATLKEMP